MKASEQFQVGDLVKLKSGGPTMTINYIRNEQEDECVCTWFNDKKEVISRHFSKATLVRIEKD